MATLLQKIGSALRTARALVALLVALILSWLLIILCFCAGTMFVYEGVGNGQLYAVLGQSPTRMAVTSVENRNHRTILPDYVATGVVSNQAERVEVRLFQEEYRRLRPGGFLDVYKLPSGRWVTAMKLDESKPIFNVLGLHFTWQLIVGLIALLYGCVSCFLRLKRYSKTGRVRAARPPTVEEARAALKDDSQTYVRWCEAAFVLCATPGTSFEDWLLCLSRSGLPAEAGAIQLYRRTKRPRADDTPQSFVVDAADWRNYLKDRKFIV